MRGGVQFCLLVVLAALISNSRADTVAIPDRLKRFILYAPAIPRSPNSGTSGVYRLMINSRNGTVDEIGILLSAGGKGIDDAAILTFFQWRFVPGKIKSLDVPVNFNRDADVYLHGAAYR